jgi:hypothetical protein
VGGIFGGIFGGSQRRKQADQFAQQQQGEIAKVVAAYKGFQIDYGSAFSQLESMRSSGKDQLGKLKGEGQKVFSRQLSPAIDAAEKELASFQKERDRRSGLVFGPPQFAAGGFVEGSRIAGWRMGNGTVAAVLHEGESVITREGTQRNRGAIAAMNAGDSLGGDVIHVSINALDGPSFDKYLRNRGGLEAIGKAVRQARREGKKTL